MVRIERGIKGGPCVAGIMPERESVAERLAVTAPGGGPKREQAMSRPAVETRKQHACNVVEGCGAGGVLLPGQGIGKGRALAIVSVAESRRHDIT